MRWIMLAALVACDAGSASLDTDTEDAVCDQVAAWLDEHRDDLAGRIGDDYTIDSIDLTSCGDLLTRDGDGAVTASIRWRGKADTESRWYLCDLDVECHVTTYDQGPVVDGCALTTDRECVREDD